VAHWFTVTNVGFRDSTIGRLTTTGNITRFPLSNSVAAPMGIIPGPDGALWFTESNGNKVGRITTAGVITEYTLPTADSLPGPIVAGPDGALWFAERNTNAIGRMTTDGVLTNEFALPTANANPLALVAAPDGHLYFTQHEDGSVARMTYGGVVTKRFKVPSGYPDGLTADSSGDLWFTQGNFGQVGRIDLKWDPPISAAGTTIAMRRFVNAERTVATFTDPDPETRPGDYDVTIRWGDGSASAGWVRRTGGGGFEVRGRHVYDRAKTFGVTVKIDDAKVSSTAVVSR
jgi:streptogramin lyase